MSVSNRRSRQPQGNLPTNAPHNGNGITEKPNGTNGTNYSNRSPQDPNSTLPQYNHNGHKVTPHIHPDGESGRRGVHPFKALKVIAKSSCRASSIMNVLWPFVPAAIALHFVKGSHHLWTFAISYIAMVPSANLLGFAGQEFARKLPRVAGTILETCLSSIVELILFMVLIAKDDGTGEIGHGSKIAVIQAAILGSILTNVLLCLGFCFIVGGIKHKEQKFHPIISEVGSGLILVAAFALMIPSAFFSSLSGTTVAEGEGYTEEQLRHDTLNISHGVAIILMVAFFLFILYNSVSHDNIFQEVFDSDELADRDRHRDLRKAKLTLTESVIAILIALTFVSLMAIFLVEEIEYVVEHGVPDFFLGLILVPLVEKAAEHITTVDEAWDNQIVSTI